MFSASASGFGAAFCLGKEWENLHVRVRMRVRRSVDWFFQHAAVGSLLAHTSSLSPCWQEVVRLATSIRWLILLTNMATNSSTHVSQIMYRDA